MDKDTAISINDIISQVIAKTEDKTKSTIEKLKKECEELESEKERLELELHKAQIKPLYLHELDRKTHLLKPIKCSVDGCDKFASAQIFEYKIDYSKSDFGKCVNIHDDDFFCHEHGSKIIAEGDEENMTYFSIDPFDNQIIVKSHIPYHVGTETREVDLYCHFILNPLN